MTNRAPTPEAGLDDQSQPDNSASSPEHTGLASVPEAPADCVILSFENGRWNISNMSLQEPSTPFDPANCLDGINDSLVNEYDIMVSAADTAKSTFKKLYAVAENLRTTLLSREEELRKVRETARSDFQKMQEAVCKALRRARAVSLRWQKLKADNQELRYRIVGLKMQIDGANQKLDRMGHLLCCICLENVKDRVTRCGHGFCGDCLAIHFGNDEEAAEPFQWGGVAVAVCDGEVSCPMCRGKLLCRVDIWPLFTGGGAMDERRQGDNTLEEFLYQ